jgi:hypothetical protein
MLDHRVVVADRPVSARAVGGQFGLHRRETRRMHRDRIDVWGERASSIRAELKVRPGPVTVDAAITHRLPHFSSNHGAAPLEGDSPRAKSDVPPRTPTPSPRTPACAWRSMGPAQEQLRGRPHETGAT